MRNTKLAVLLCFVFLSACVSVEGKKGSPEDIASVNINLAKSYYAKGLYDIAEQKLGKALAAQADNVAANTLLALVYDQQGKVTKADEQFEKALDFASDNSVEFAEINNNFAVFLCKNGKWPEAEKRFLNAIGVPDYQTKAGALENAGLCALSVDDYEKAGLYFEKALKENANLARSILGLAKVEANAGQWSDVKVQLMAFHARVNATEESLYLMALAEGHLNNMSAREEFKNQLRSQFPGSKYLNKLD